LADGADDTDLCLAKVSEAELNARQGPRLLNSPANFILGRGRFSISLELSTAVIILLLQFLGNNTRQLIHYLYNF